jgi:hypothetical protein
MKKIALGGLQVLITHQTEMAYARPYLTVGDSKLHLLDLLPIDMQLWRKIFGALARRGGGGRGSDVSRFGTDSEDAFTAVHEAGHYLMLELVRHKPPGLVPRITIVAGDGYMGRVYMGGWGVLALYGPRQGVDAMLISCGGYAALRALGMPKKRALEGTTSDFEDAEKVRALWNLPSLDYCQKKAVKMMSSDANRQAIRALALALLEHREIDGHQAAAIVREVVDRPAIYWGVPCDFSKPL